MTRARKKDEQRRQKGQGRRCHIQDFACVRPCVSSVCVCARGIDKRGKVDKHMMSSGDIQLTGAMQQMGPWVQNECACVLIHGGPHWCVCVGHGDTFGFRSDVTLIGPKGCKVQVTRWSCGHHGDHGQSLQLLWPFSYANSSASFKRRPFPSSEKYRIQSSKDTAGKQRETSTIL